LKLSLKLTSIFLEFRNGSNYNDTLIFLKIRHKKNLKFLWRLQNIVWIRTTSLFNFFSKISHKKETHFCISLNLQASGRIRTTSLFNFSKIRDKKKGHISVSRGISRKLRDGFEPYLYLIFLKLVKKKENFCFF
jgi:hypothetical protein